MNSWDMRKQWAIPVLAGILILGTLGLTQMAYAGPAIEFALILAPLSVVYIPDTEEFEIEFGTKFGMVKALQNADFSIPVELTINSPELPSGGVILTQTFSGGEVSSDERGRVKVQFHWDRSVSGASSFEGMAEVTIEAQILNPSGKPVANSETSRTFSDVEIVPCSPAICSG